MRIIPYYGAKNRLSPKYPAPKHRIIIEPFAGSAGYSFLHYEHDVMLYEKNEKTFAAMSYAIRASSDEILSLPLLGQNDHIDSFDLTFEQKCLIGFWLNNGTTIPCKTLSKWGRENNERVSFWSAKCRARLSETVKKIKHWKIFNFSYEKAPDIEATWFIDPPYQKAGKYYPCSSKDLDFSKLAEWCKSRHGQTIVCENQGADWLPFKFFRQISGTSKDKETRRKSTEVIWINEN